MSLIPEYPAGAEWTPADDLAAAKEAQELARVLDAAKPYADAEPHWDAAQDTYWLSERAERILICTIIAGLLVCAGISAAVAL